MQQAWHRMRLFSHCVIDQRCSVQRASPSYHTISSYHADLRIICLNDLLSRISNLEDCVSGLQNRVGRLERSEATATSTHSSCNDDEPVSYSSTLEASESKDPTDGIGSIMFTKEAESGFFGTRSMTIALVLLLIRLGPSSNIALTRHIVRATTNILKTTIAATSPASPVHLNVQSHMLNVSRPSSPDPPSEQWLSATEPYVLPSNEETLQLIDLFFSTTGILFPYIDRLSFLKRYRQLSPTSLKSARRTWLGLLNMVLAMATSASSAGLYSACERSTRSEIFFKRASRICEKEIHHGTSLEVGMFSAQSSSYYLPAGNTFQSSFFS